MRLYLLFINTPYYLNNNLLILSYNSLEELLITQHIPNINNISDTNINPNKIIVINKDFITLNNIISNGFNKIHKPPKDKIKII